jgi:hypothetical protein
VIEARLFSSGNEDALDELQNQLLMQKLEYHFHHVVKVQILN